MGKSLSATEQFLAEKAEVIRGLEREAKRVVFKTACEIGEHLSQVQEQLSRNNAGGGTWLEWLGREFPSWGTQRTAYNYIGAFRFAQKHRGQLETVANSIDLSAVYLLNAPSTPPDVATRVLDSAAESGEKVSRGEVKRVINEVRRLPPPKPPARPEPPPEAYETDNSRVVPTNRHEGELVSQHDPEAGRRRDNTMIVREIGRTLDIGLQQLASVTPDEAFAVTAQGELVEMSNKAKQIFIWFRGLGELLNTSQPPARALDLAAEPPSGKPITNTDRVLKVLRDKPSGVYVGFIAGSANLTRGEVDTVLNGLMKDGAVLCAPGGIYRLNSARAA